MEKEGGEVIITRVTLYTLGIFLSARKDTGINITLMGIVIAYIISVLTFEQI